MPRMVLLAAGLALAAAACGGDDDGDGAIPQSGDPATTSLARPGTAREVTIVGENIAFDITTIEATVGETLAIAFDNRDDGTPHNLHVMGTSAGDAKTEIADGPVTQTLDVTFDEAGEFEYLCDVHPQQMTGTITVAP